MFHPSLTLLLHPLPDLTRSTSTPDQSLQIYMDYTRLTSFCTVVVVCFLFSPSLSSLSLSFNHYRKLSTITLDNCSTNDAMAITIVDRLDHNALLLDGKLFHMCCCAHILNLIVKDGIDVIKEGIEKIRDSMGYWIATPKREENFRETATQLRIRSTKKLGLDCATRWNSTYLMLQTSILYKEIFFRLKQRDNQYKTFPSEQDWEFAKEIYGR
ncbi:hypothetical protein L1049_005039 [Liquidambar formosana]|uniref:Uncharacterized protein n=1 Tax=Liquidambar formosana TaxID=63359 RepID=A0AAP0WXC9_LIQFO